MLSTVLKQVKSHPAVSISDLLLLMLLSVNNNDSFILKLCLRIVSGVGCVVNTSSSAA